MRHSTVIGACVVVCLGWFTSVACAGGIFYPCYRATTPPKIDGVLDDVDWLSAERIGFADLVTASKPGLVSTARMMWDDDCLYLAFQFADTNIWARITERDVPLQEDFKAYTENFAKLYLDPDGDGRNYTEMHFSPSGAINDKWQSVPWKKEAREACHIQADESSKAHWKWNCDGMRSAVAIQGTLNQPNDTDQEWVVEVAIPFASLKQFSGKSACPPRAEDTWRVHLGRRYQTEGDDPSTAIYWTWPVLGVPDCHNPDRWGYVVFVTDAHPPLPATFADLPKAEFQWKMLWVHSGQTKSKDAIQKMVEDAVRMKFTAICAEPCDGLAEAVHEKGLKFFAWMINLRGGAEMKTFLGSHPDHVQQLGLIDTALLGKPRINSDRENINTGSWLCPDRGLLDVERRQLEECLVKYGADGIALDYIGYRNYHACFCVYSEEEREHYATEHPELTAAQVLWKYSETSLERYTRQIRDAVKAIKPDAELAIHIYPDFDPNPLIGARLPVEYCGQTAAWFYEPFWSYSTIADVTLRYKAAQGRVHEFNRFVPFVGAYSRFPKTPEQLRTEIRIAGLAGNGTIMIAFYDTFMTDPLLAQVLVEEF